MVWLARCPRRPGAWRGQQPRGACRCFLVGRSSRIWSLFWPGQGRLRCGLPGFGSGVRCLMSMAFSHDDATWRPQEHAPGGASEAASSTGQHPRGPFLQHAAWSTHQVHAVLNCISAAAGPSDGTKQAAARTHPPRPQRTRSRRIALVADSGPHVPFFSALLLVTRPATC